MCKDRKHYVASFARESSHSCLFLFHRLLVLTQHWENTLTALNVTGYESFSFSVCLVLNNFNCTDAFCIAGPLQIFHWIRRYLTSMGTLLVFCAVASPCQASVVLLNL